MKVSLIIKILAAIAIFSILWETPPCVYSLVETSDGLIGVAFIIAMLFVIDHTLCIIFSAVAICIIKSVCNNVDKKLDILHIHRQQELHDKTTKEKAHGDNKIKQHAALKDAQHNHPLYSASIFERLCDTPFDPDPNFMPTYPDVTCGKNNCLYSIKKANLVDLSEIHRPVCSRTYAD